MEAAVAAAFVAVGMVGCELGAWARSSDFAFGDIVDRLAEVAEVVVGSCVAAAVGEAVVVVVVVVVVAVEERRRFDHPAFRLQRPEPMYPRDPSGVGPGILRMRGVGLV